MNLTLNSLLLAATLGLAIAPPALAQDPERLENSLTAGGLNIAPRYMTHNFDTDVSLLGGFIGFPTTSGKLLGYQTALQTRLSDQLVLLGNLGSLTELGLRGPLWHQGDATLGWDAHYRSESYYEIQPGYGLNPSLLGMPGSMAAGGEVELNGMARWQGLNVYGSPVAAVMSNRSFVGCAAGVDVPMGRWSLGYAAEYRRNFNPADSSVAKIVDQELQHSVGLAYTLSDRAFLQANYYYLPSDSYGIPYQTFLVGIGTRLTGENGQSKPRVLQLPQ